jgi:hypothetical protein
MCSKKNSYAYIVEDKMPIEEFIQEIFEENQEELDEIVRLQEILDQLDSNESVIYRVSITTNL